MSNLFCQLHNEEITDYCQQEDCQNHKQSICCYKCSQYYHINHRIVNIKKLYDDINQTKEQLKQIYSENELKADKIRELVNSVNKLIKNDIEKLTRITENSSLQELLKCYKICNPKSLEKLKVMSQYKQDHQTSLKYLIEQYQIQITGRNFDTALKYTQDILKQVPQCSIFQGEKSRIEQTIKNQKDHIDQGNTLFQQNNYQEALNHYEQIINENTNNFTLCLQTGICLRKLKRNQESINYFLICDNLDPINHTLLYEKSQALFDTEDVQGLGDCHRIMKTTNHNKQPLIYGQLLLLKGEQNQAIKQFEQAGQKDPEAKLFKAIALQKIAGPFYKLEASLIKEDLIAQNYKHERLDQIQKF